MVRREQTEANHRPHVAYSTRTHRDAYAIRRAVLHGLPFKAAHFRGKRMPSEKDRGKGEGEGLHDAHLPVSSFPAPLVVSDRLNDEELQVWPKAARTDLT